MKTFKIGDRVKIKFPHYRHGDMATITDINDKLYQPIEVKFDDHKDCWIINYHKRALEKIEMATLKCSDGTVINISAETEKELRKAFGEKTYKTGDVFVSSYNDKYMLVQTKFYDNEITLIGIDKGKYGYGRPYTGTNVKVQDINRITQEEFNKLDLYKHMSLVN